MDIKAKDLIRILSAVDGDSDVVFHIDDDDNVRYKIDSFTIKEGETYDCDYKETDLVLHISITPAGAYNLRLNEEGYEEVEMSAEEALIRQAMDKAKGDRKKAAKALGISERTLYRRIKEYNIE